MDTFTRQVGHIEVLLSWLLSWLISGLTNVAAFTVDKLGHVYAGIAGIKREKVNMHDVGHGTRPKPRRSQSGSQRHPDRAHQGAARLMWLTIFPDRVF